jgi:hypothetical protein
VLWPARSAVALALVALLGATALGCGKAKPDQATQVRATVAAFETAVSKGDVDTICAKLFSRRIVVKLEDVGLPCEVALSSLRSVQRPKLKVLAVKVRGKQAFATVRTNALGQKPSTDTIQLVAQGTGWRIDSLAGAVAGPPDPANPAPEPEKGGD